MGLENQHTGFKFHPEILPLQQRKEKHFPESSLRATERII